MSIGFRLRAQHLPDAGSVRRIVEVAHDDDLGYGQGILRPSTCLLNDGIDLMAQDPRRAVPCLDRLQFPTVLRGPVVHETMERILTIVKELGIEEVPRDHGAVLGIPIRDGLAADQLETVQRIHDGRVDAPAVRSFIMHPSVMILLQRRHAEERLQGELTLHLADSQDADGLLLGETENGLVEVVSFPIEA